MVTVIVGILGAMALPRYSGFISTQQLEAASRRISADLALAQRYARQSSTNRTVVFDVAGNQYTLVGMNDLDHKALPYIVHLGDEPYGARIVSASLGGDAQIIFNGFGAPDSGGSVVIAVGAKQQTVAVDAGTGRPTKLQVVPIELIIE